MTVLREVKTFDVINEAKERGGGGNGGSMEVEMGGRRNEVET